MPSHQRIPGMNGEIEKMVKEYIGQALSQSPMESARNIRENSVGHLNKLLNDGKELQRIAKQFDGYWADDEDNDYQRDLADHIQKFVKNSLQRAYQATETMTDSSRTSPPPASEQRTVDANHHTEPQSAGNGPYVQRRSDSIPVQFDDRVRADQRPPVVKAKRRKVKKGGVPVLFSVPRARRPKN